jgi:integrase
VLIMRRRGRYWHVRGSIRCGKETREVKEHSSGCRERGAAEEYAHKLEADIRAEILYGAAGLARRMTCADAMLEYARRPGGLHRMDLWRIGKLEQLLGGFVIADVLAGRKEFKVKRCQGLAPATVDRFRATLQAAINHAAREHGFGAPAIPHIKYSNQRVRFLTKEQQDRLLAAYPPHVQPIALMLCFQGCRTQEALQLKRNHLDLARGVVFFERTKTGEPRTVELHHRVKEALERWLHDVDHQEEYVFLTLRARPWADTRDYKYPGGNPLRKAPEAACKLVDISPRWFTVHDWRHHFASRMVMAGVDLETIKRMGGWKSLRMLERYAAVSTEHMAEAVRRLA